MQLGMTLHVAQRMSQEQRLTLKQSLEQMLKQELRLELKLAIKQILAIMQKLEQALKLGTMLDVSDRDMRKLVDAVSQVRTSEWMMVSDRIGRMRHADVLASIFETLGDWDKRYEDLAFMGRMIRRRHEDAQREERGQVLAMRIVLRDPRWFGGGGTHPYDLWSLLRSIPQLTGKPPTIRWVLAGGWAVELLTGAHLRQHHDIDTLVLTKRLLRLDTDVVVPTNYFDVLSCSGTFVRDECITTVAWSYKKGTRFVHVVKPEFLFASKFLRVPRPQDWEDVKLLVHRFCHTWDRVLLQKLCGKQACGFHRTPDLIQILSMRDSRAIISALSTFHTERAYDIAS